MHFNYFRRYFMQNLNNNKRYSIGSRSWIKVLEWNWFEVWEKQLCWIFAFKIDPFFSVWKCIILYCYVQNMKLYFITNTNQHHQQQKKRWKKSMWFFEATDIFIDISYLLTRSHPQSIEIQNEWHKHTLTRHIIGYSKYFASIYRYCFAFVRSSV